MLVQGSSLEEAYDAMTAAQIGAGFLVAFRAKGEVLRRSWRVRR